jgi:hypothetical protein
MTTWEISTVESSTHMHSTTTTYAMRVASIHVPIESYQ